MTVQRLVAFSSLAFVALGMGCSDPSSPIPQGAFSANFGMAVGTGVACPVASGDVRIGLVSAAQKAPIADGDDGTSVSCRVARSGSGFQASANLVRGNTRFHMPSANVGDGAENKGSIAIASATTAGKSYGPASGTFCSFKVIEANEGQMWLSFECPHTKTGSSENEQCSINNGFLYFDNCDS